MGKENILRGVEEVVTEDELFSLYEKKDRKAYIGFEPSGYAHIGWKLCARKIIDLCNEGFDVKILLADWHAWINDKLSGDMENIKICGNYMKDCFRGMGVQKADFVWASDIISDKKYWEIVLKTAKCTSLARIKRSMTIMGRGEEEAEMDSSKFLYPLMQVADIFYLDVDLAYGGMDQRKAHMLAREVADRYKWKKVVALHTPLLPGLKGGERMDPIEVKMSKSKPDTCIFLHDDPKEIERKIKKAFCQERVIKDNPIIGIAKNIIFEENDKMIIEREKKHGGDIELKSYSELERIYEDGVLHPMDLKNSVAKYLVSSIEPIRKYLEKSENFKRMKEIIG